MSNLYVPDPEQLGRRRFPDNKGYRRQLSTAASRILQTYQGLLPSNYSKEPITNLAVFYRTHAREIARINGSVEAINRDKEYTETRVKFLQQVLGERLFLQNRIAPFNYNDESYRDYLISIKDAYLKGSRVEDIEYIASQFTGLDVNIRELYLEARDPASSLDVSDTHKMVVDVFIDDILRAGFNINQLHEALDFFINLVRPAHVLYDTNLIWTEQIDVNKVHDLIFGDLGGGCVPFYDYDRFEEPTIFAQQILVVHDQEIATGEIESVHHSDSIFYLSNGVRVIVEPGPDGTRIYDINGRRVTLNALNSGDLVKITYLVVPGSFQFWWYPDFLFNNYYDQFYPSIYRRPAFQENVKKEMDANGRFPLQIKTTPTTICDRWVQDLLDPLYEDLRGNCAAGADRTGYYSSELMSRMGSPRYSWPYDRSDIHDPELFGDNWIVFMPNTPLCDSSAQEAVPADVLVNYDGTTLYDAVNTVDASTGRVTLISDRDYWDTSAGSYPTTADVLSYRYHYCIDSTAYDATTDKVFGISHWQMPTVPLVTGDGSGTLATTSDVSLQVDGTAIGSAVTYVSALLGHVEVNDSTTFWALSELGRNPVQGDVFKFSYYWGERYTYPLLFDDPARYLDGIVSSSSPYGFMMDGVDASSTANSAAPTLEPSVIGYRYRANLLHHSSVLNSPDTFQFNDFQKPVKRASIINQEETFNHSDVFFSPEFLEDQNKVVLNDQYLDNGLDPVLKLGPGTPPFQKTYSYHPGLIYERKLHNIREHHHPLMYSNLLLKEFPEENDGVPTAPICDSEKLRFGIRLGEDEIPPIEECPPWILFDTVDEEDIVVNIPGEYAGVLNLRIPDKLLRHNFILREIGSTGVANYTYSLTTSVDSTTNVFYLPESFPYDTGTETVNFPALPVMKDATTLAGINDISVTVDGQPWTVDSLDATTGRVELTPFPTIKHIETQVTLTAIDAGRGEVYLPGIPLDSATVTMTVIRGTAQYLNQDYVVSGRILSWYGTNLYGLLQEDDLIRVSYEVDPIISAEIVFNYKILSSATVTSIDVLQSRIFDNGYLFGSACPDSPGTFMGVEFKEYYTQISDYSEGIKISFFNKDTATIEDHVFSGPVFEIHEASQDQIGVPDNFNNGLVRIKGPFSGNPLLSETDYGFINDALVRARKKTFKELLPDRTFRTLELTELLPV